MTVKNMIGNAMIFAGTYVGTKTAVLTSTATEVTTTEYMTQFNTMYSLVGFVVPNWWGIVFYVLFLVFGAIASANQATPVDDKFKYAFLKPFYSLAFGVLVTLFVLPIFYPEVTIWALIVPAGFFAAVGAVIIYYVIAFFTSNKLWQMLSDWGYKSIAEYLTGLPSRIKAALKAFAEDDK